MKRDRNSERYSRSCAFTKPNPKTFKNKTALWILGFNCQFGYIILLTAAQDIIHKALPEVEYTRRPRYCCAYSTGTVLFLLSILTVTVQWLQAQFDDCFYFFTTTSMAFSMAGYYVLAFGTNLIMGTSGVVLVALGHCIGDYELSKRAALYQFSIAKGFRQGVQCTIGTGPIIYTALRCCNIETMYIFLSFIALPLSALCIFWLLLSPPLMPRYRERDDSEYSLTIFTAQEPALIRAEDKIEYTSHIIQSVFPLFLVYLFQGISQQGLYEFVYFRDNFIAIKYQYALNICCYNMGLYACLVTKNLMLVKHIVICTAIQFLACYFLLMDAIFFFMGYIWCILLLSYIQGVLTGVAHTSALEQILAKEPTNYLDMAEAILKKSYHIVLILSGILDFGIHYFLSRSSEPSRP